jgi:hypothetical protein
MSQLITMADDPDARVRIAAFHALACERCKGDTCAPGADEVLEPVLQHLVSDPDAHVRARAAELVGNFAIPMAAPSPPWQGRTPKTRARSSGRRLAGSRLAAPSTNGPSHARSGNGKALNQTTREWTR